MSDLTLWFTRCPVCGREQGPMVTRPILTGFCNGGHIDFEGEPNHMEQVETFSRDYALATAAQALRSETRLNKAALESAIREVPGWDDFDGTPASAVGAATSIIREHAKAVRDGHR